MVFNERRFHAAAGRGDTKAVRYFMNRGIDVHTKDSFDRTPLHKAAFGGHVNVSKLLVNTGRARLNVRSKDGKTPLHRAVEKRHLPMAQYLVNAGASLNVAESTYGFHPLHIAVVNNDLAMVSYLISRGADVNALVRFNGMTPLHLAAWYHTKRKSMRGMMKLLLTLGADDTRLDSHGVQAPVYFYETQFSTLPREFIQSELAQGRMDIRKALKVSVGKPTFVNTPITPRPLHPDANGIDPITLNKVPLNRGMVFRSDVANGRIRRVFDTRTIHDLLTRGQARHPLTRKPFTVADVVQLKKALVEDEHNLYKNLRENRTARTVRRNMEKTITTSRRRK